MTLNEWTIKWKVSANAINDLGEIMTMDTVGDGEYITESGIQKDLILQASENGGRLWRNNNGACVDNRTGRSIRFGLANDSKRINDQLKSSDLIGIQPTLITRDHVGEVFGRFVAIEVKKKNWKYKNTYREQAQLNYITLVKKLGGISGFATGRGGFL